MSRCVRLAERLERAARCALASEHGARRVESALRARPSAACALVAVGKAAWAMAEGAMRVSPAIARGVVVGKEPPPVELPAALRVYLAGHPLPDERSVRATQAALELARSLSAADELLVLVSGGTSALLGGPVAGVTLASLRAETEALLRSGADIVAINAVRRRLGAALGGRLLRATPARVRGLLLSDVLSGDPRTIGSGPLHPDEETAEERARRDVEILAGPEQLLVSASAAIRAEGLVPRCAEHLVEGELELLVARLAREAAALSPGEAFLAVGEPTLVLRGQGRGGRARHVALRLAEVLGSMPDRVGLALASDGSDGSPDAAGAIVSSETLAMARARGLDLRAAVEACDSGAVLEALSATRSTGPTGTNLTDLFVVARAGAE